MKFLVEYPIFSDADGGRWLRPENAAEFGRVAEAAGADGIALTDHPAPSQKWLQHGGHETLDPFVGLGFWAAATERLRLMTFLAVVPYRNPFLLAKSMNSVDILSGGRATFVLGTGYLRSEFAALGVDFDERNALFDEAIEVLHGVWSTDAFSFDGRHFRAVGQTITPGPVQKPHPPLWLGGNARVVRDRVARWGQGWAPLLGSATLAQTARTRSIGSDEELAHMIRDLGDRLEANQRARGEVDILAGVTDDPPGVAASAQRHIDAIGRLGELGVTWTNLPVDRSSFAAAIDSIQRFGAEVLVHVS